MRKQYHLFYSLLAFTLLLFPGCSNLSNPMGEYRNSYHGLKVRSIQLGLAGYDSIGPIDITDCKFDGIKRVGGGGPLGDGKYDPTSQASRSYWFGGWTWSFFEFPRTIEITWFIFGEQRLYHTVIAMPSYEELEKILGVKKLPDLGITLVYDMPPQVKCFVVPWPLPRDREEQYYLAATGMGTPVEIFDQSERSYYDLLTLDECKRGNHLPDEVCAKYRNSGPDAEKRLLRLITRGG